MAKRGAGKKKSRPVKGKMTAAKLDIACLFDDAFMTECFKYEPIATVQQVLRAVLNKPMLRVTEVKVQKPVENPHGRSVRFDVYAEDEDGTLYAVEIQRVGKYDTPDELLWRALYDLGRLSSIALKEKEPYSKLREHYVVYLFDHDIMERGLPVYVFRTACQQAQEVVIEKSGIILVNGSPKMAGENTPLAQLVHDFAQSDPDQMHNGPLKDAVTHFKTTKEGREKMIGTLTDYMNEQARDMAQDMARDMARDMANKRLQEARALAVIDAYRDVDLSDAEIVHRLQARIDGLSREQAQEYLLSYDRLEAGAEKTEA